jgi:hypothetical protein
MNGMNFRLTPLDVYGRRLDGESLRRPVYGGGNESLDSFALSLARPQANSNENAVFTKVEAALRKSNG